MTRSLALVYRPELWVRADDEAYGPGTLRMAETTLDTRGWTTDLLIG